MKTTAPKVGVAIIKFSTIMKKTNETTADNPSEQKPQEKKNLRRKSRCEKVQEYSISVKTLEQLGMDCMTWGEAKHYVDLMEKVFGMNPPPFVKASIRRIKRKFRKKSYHQVIMTKKVVMKYNHLEAMNKITKNKHVRL